MSRESQQIAQIVQRILRTSKGRRSWKMIALLCAGALLYSLVLQPALEKSLGISLPSITGGPNVVADGRNGNSRGTGSSGSSTRSTNHSDSQGVDAPPEFNPSELSDLLEEVGRQAYRTPAGLRYTRGSEHGHRIAHVLAHTRDEPNQQGQHGVYDDDDPATVLRLIDKAYLQAQSGLRTKTKREDDRVVYTVDMGHRIGYVGGTSGKRRGYPAADHIRIVVQGDRLITAFPVRL